MHEKPLGFDLMHENNIYFLCFWNEVFFLIFFETLDKNQIILISSLYLTMQVYDLILDKIIEKTCNGPTNDFKMVFEIF